MRHSTLAGGCFTIFMGMVALSLPTPLFAAGGDILLFRDVQPRVATRPPLVPDPNPKVVNPKPSTHVGEDLQIRRAQMPGELNDGDFAAVTSGARLTQQVLSPSAQNTYSNPTGLINHSSVAGNNPVGHAGGALGNVEGQVTRSISQGLQPLQILQGR